MEPLRIGAVAYDPKVVTIWEGMRTYLEDEARLPVEVVLYQRYEDQNRALLAGRIDVAWNTNLAYVQAEAATRGACRPIAMRDADLDWRTHVFVPKGSPIASLEDLRGKALALGSRDSGHAAILPVHFLAAAGLVADREYRALRFDTDVGKHGDTGRSELEVLRAVVDGRADAGAVGSPFWKRVRAERLVPPASLESIWESSSYTHCVFTARPGLAADSAGRFATALYAMSWNNPRHRPILEAEGLRRWVPPVDGYADLREAAIRQGFVAAPAVVHTGESR